MRGRTLLLGLILLAPISVLLAAAAGSIPLGPAQLWGALTGSERPLYQQLVFELRLPRAAAAFATGGLLAFAGALMQVLLRNPLADPYVLGISGGAAVGALGAMLLGLTAAWISGAAFGGALLSTFLVFGLAHGRGSWTANRLLLTGVVMAAGWGAVISFILTLSPQQGVRGMLFWLMGDLGGAHVWLPGIGLLLLVVGATLPAARSLNLLARGELQAGALGVRVGPLRLAIYGLASLVTAAAVTIAGTVGFVGLVVPHMIRLVSGSDHRVLLPAAALGGGILLVLADTLARSAFAPMQLPVGVLTAFIGVPLFLFLLHRGT